MIGRFFYYLYGKHQRLLDSLTRLVHAALSPPLCMFAKGYRECRQGLNPSSEEPARACDIIYPYNALSTSSSLLSGLLLRSLTANLVVSGIL